MKTTEITANQVREIIEIIDGGGYGSETRFYKDYSGRGMYGRTCAGFVHAGSAFKVGVAMGQVLGEDAFELSAAQDSMGYDTITYFDGLVLAAGETWDEEDD